jgi:RNA polymerase sigma-70 factor (ECF subfamily)
MLGPLHALFGAGSFAGWTDGQLLERFREGRDEIGERAFAALVERHGAGVLRVCRGVLGDPHDADDAFQATFLVLARRARSIRDPRAVGHWLLGVAYRVAGCARAAAIRRRAHERRAAEGITPFVSGEEPIDCGPALREELGRLPEKFQLPLVLCYLEGLTQEEVARRLGWPIGTVRSRLARGRERLKSRLVLRGVAPTAVAMAVGAWRQAEAAVVPEALVAMTARAAAGSKGTAGAVSTAVVTLTEEVLRTMISTKLKLGAAAVLMAGLIATGAGVVAGQSGGRPGQGSTEGGRTPAAAVKAELPGARPGDSRLFVGVVDRGKVADLGLTVDHVIQQVAAAYHNPRPGERRHFRVDPPGGDRFFVDIPSPDREIRSIRDLKNLSVPIPGSPGGQILLGNLVTFAATTRDGLEGDVAARDEELVRLTVEVEQARAKLNLAQRDIQELRAQLRALRGRSEPTAAKTVPPVAKEIAAAASDQERRLRAVEDKLDRLLAERTPPREAPKGSSPRPEVVSPVEMAAVWQRLQRDGFIGRFDADPVVPEPFYTRLYQCYLGRRPSSQEMKPLLASYGPGADQVRLDPESVVRRMLSCEAFWSSPLAPAIVRQSDPGSIPRF